MVDNTACPPEIAAERIPSWWRDTSLIPVRKFLPNNWPGIRYFAANLGFIAMCFCQILVFCMSLWGKFSTSFPGSLFFPGRKETPREQGWRVFFFQVYRCTDYPSWPTLINYPRTGFFCIRVVSKVVIHKEKPEKSVKSQELITNNSDFLNLPLVSRPNLIPPISPT